MTPDDAAGELRHIAIDAPTQSPRTTDNVERLYQHVIQGRPAGDAALEPGHQYLDFAKALRDYALARIAAKTVDTKAVAMAYRNIIQRLSTD